MVVLSPERSEGGIVLTADVMPSVADRVMALIRDWEVDDADYLLTRQDVVAPGPQTHARLAAGEEVGWVEVMGEARAHARPLGRYLALMRVSAVLAALAVIQVNPILIVGAMAVSPDLLPISAACVGIVGGRPRLATRAAGTLLLGIGLTWAVSAALAWGLGAVDILSSDFQVSTEDLHGLAHVDYSTVLVALAAGVAAMLAFETRAAAAVGVGISVTTIPASALFGVALGLGDADAFGGAAAVLAVNVSLLLVSGSLTLAVQRRLASSRSGPAPSAAG